MKNSKPAEKELQITLADSRIKTINLGKLQDNKIAERCAKILAEIQDEYVRAEVHFSNAKVVRSARGLIIHGYWKVTGEWVSNKGA